MAMDMPPRAVEYRIESVDRTRAAPRSALQEMVSAARMKSRADMVEMPKTADMLPRIDPASAALSRNDRTAMIAARDAGPGKAVAAPSSYVGDRIRLEVVRSKALEASLQGRLRVEDAAAVQCRTIAVAMDRRAGAYIVGGERAADAARHHIPAGLVEKCRESVALARGAGPAVGNDHSRPVSPTLASSRPSPQRIDPIGTVRQRIDPVGSSRQRIDPIGSTRQRIDPIRTADRGI